MGEALGAAFGLLLICCSIICAYVWAIGPERESRRLEADWETEKRHCKYRENRRKPKRSRSSGEN